MTATTNMKLNIIQVFALFAITQFELLDIMKNWGKK